MQPHQTKKQNCTIIINTGGKIIEEDNSSEHSEEDDDEKEWNELQKEMKQKCSKSKLQPVQSSSWSVHAPSSQK